MTRFRSDEKADQQTNATLNAVLRISLTWASFVDTVPKMTMHDKHWRAMQAAIDAAVAEARKEAR